MSIDLHWIPLGADGTGVVRFNGRVYERIISWREHRQPLDLYHTALTVGVPEGHVVVETMWPSPAGDPADRGVVVQAPVFSRRLPSIRVFRYEVRRWSGGLLADADQAVGGPRRIGTAADGQRLLALVDAVPALVWGRDERRVGDMWNSNSVVSWLLTRVGLDMEAIRPPAAGRAPGWDAGVAVARTG
jgi:hypothetical protein